MSGMKSVFGTALNQAYATDIEGVGQVRIESDPVLGDRYYRWVRNGTAGTLAVNSVVGFEQNETAGAITLTANTDLSKLRSAAAFPSANAIVGSYARILDDAGAAGAAPEGEVRRVATWQSTSEITVDAPFTAAPTTGDTVHFIRPWHIVASADGMVKPEVAGVLMATLLTMEYGWVQFKGFHPGVLAVAAGTTLAAGAALKAGAGIVVVAADNADNGEVIGASYTQLTTDTVLRRAVVLLDCGV